MTCPDCGRESNCLHCVTERAIDALKDYIAELRATPDETDD